MKLSLANEMAPPMLGNILFYVEKSGDEYQNDRMKDYQTEQSERKKK